MNRVLRRVACQIARQLGKTADRQGHGVRAARERARSPQHGGIRRLLTRPLLIAISVIFVAGASAGPVRAGGPSVAAAPTVVYGQQEFGNTVTDSGRGTPDCTDDGTGYSWWLLPVVTGDRVTVDLSGQDNGDGFIVRAWSIGTNDFNYTQRDPFASSNQADALELAFTAPQSGAMPMSVSDCDSVGAYNFTASVEHVIVGSLHIARRFRHSTWFAGSARNPDGVALTDPAIHLQVQLRVHGRWVTLGSSSQPFHFTIAWTDKRRGHWQSVRGVFSGPGYLSAATRAIRVKG